MAKKKTKVGSILQKAKSAVVTYGKNVAGGAGIVASAVKKVVEANKAGMSANALQGTLLNTAAAKSAFTTPSGVPTTTAGKIKAAAGIPQVGTPAPVKSVPGIAASPVARNQSLAAGGFVDSQGRTVQGTPSGRGGSSSSTSFSDQPMMMSMADDGSFVSDESQSFGSTDSDDARFSSQFSSFAVAPQVANEAKKTYENFNLRLKDTMNNSWNSQGTKQDLAKGIFESTANEFAKPFATTQDFSLSYNTNPTFKQSIDRFVADGGDVNSITSRITTTPTAVSAPSQDIYQYLLKGQVQNPTPGQFMAYATLIPEQKVAQDEIAQIAKIPEQYRSLYFGSSEEVGILEKKRIESEEAIKAIKRKQKDEVNDLRAQAQYVIELNNAEFEAEAAKIEENRLTAKNYMTGTLAKLGALNTTGAAPLAIATLEERYSRQAQTLRVQTEFRNREIQNKLTDAINDLENDRDDKINKVQSDLTKDNEEVLKEVLKLEQTASKEIFNITGRYAKDLRMQTEKYSKTAKGNAANWTAEYNRLLSKYNPAGLSKITAPSGTKSSGSTKNSGVADRLIASRGPDRFVDPAVYEAEYERWVKSGKSGASFKTNFPPKDWINPSNRNLPLGLRSSNTSTKASGKSGVTIDDL